MSNRLCKSVHCVHHSECRQYKTDLCVKIMDMVHPQFQDVPAKRRIVIVDSPKRVIENNKIFYKIPIKTFDEIGNIGDEITFLTVTEEQMTNMLNAARETFEDNETNKAYA